MKKFNLDINLDDEQECSEFVLTYDPCSDGVIAQYLGISNEKDGVLLANRLMQFARRRWKAFDLRRAGAIQDALKLEAECDKIYSEDIQPVCNCW